jgi:hypothetical protein
MSRGPRALAAFEDSLLALIADRNRLLNEFWQVAKRLACPYGKLLFRIGPDVPGPYRDDVRRLITSTWIEVIFGPVLLYAGRSKRHSRDAAMALLAEGNGEIDRAKSPWPENNPARPRFREHQP